MPPEAPPSSVRVRRARCLVGMWEGQDFVVENYLAHKRTSLAPIFAHFLSALGEYVTWDRAVTLLGGIDGADQLLRRLTAQGVLVVDGSALARSDDTVDSVWEWGQDARFFHYATRDVPYEEDLAVQRESLARLARDTPAPEPFKEYGRSDVDLPGSFNDRRGEFWDALLARRTRRSFRREPISLEAFSTILLWTWGATATIENPDFGPYILRTSPSGGARHPIEAYPMVWRVEGVPPGLYHYSVKRHALELLREGIFEDLGVRLCANQPWFRDAAAIFFMTGVIERSMWKYKHSHAYRVLQMDAGHLGQTFHLVCTRLGLAPFTTSATADRSIESEIGLDGVTEVALYVAATGHPASGQEPAAARLE